MTFARNINKISEFYIIFAPKMPEFYIIIARKIFSRFFFFGGGEHVPSLPPVSYACDFHPTLLRDLLLLVFDSVCLSVCSLKQNNCYYFFISLDRIGRFLAAMIDH